MANEEAIRRRGVKTAVVLQCEGDGDGEGERGSEEVRLETAFIAGSDLNYKPKRNKKKKKKNNNYS